MSRISADTVNAGRRWARRRGDVAGAVVVFCVIFGLLLISSPYERNQLSMAQNATLVAPLALAVVGTTLTILTRGFDLSVGGVVSVANVLAATWMVELPVSPWLTALAIVAVGVAVGAVNGYLIAVVGLQSLAVTLAGYISLSGLALIILPVPGGAMPTGFSTKLQGTVAGLPVPIWVLLGVTVLWVAFTKTRTGIALPALGADRTSTSLSGVKTARVEIAAYTIAGGFYSLAGIYLAAGTASGDPAAGTPFLLNAFAAVALGFISFRGGYGSVVAGIFGAASLMLLPKLLFGFGVSNFWTGAIQGVAVLVALALPLVARRLSSLMTRSGASTSADVVASRPSSLESSRTDVAQVKEGERK